MAKEPVVIIGGTGFCGPHLVRQLLADGYPVRVMSRRGPNGLNPWQEEMLRGAEVLRGDMSNPFDLTNAISGAETVIHAASASKSRNSDVAIEQDIDINLKGTVSIIQTAGACGAKRLVYLSSAGAIYGIGQGRPYIESDACQPLSSYGIVKLAAESYVTHLGAAHGLSTLIARISNPFGPGQTGADGQGIMAVFSRLIVKGQPVRLFGDGSAERDYITVEDAMRALHELMGMGEEGIVNIASGQSSSISSILDMLEDVMGQTAERTYMQAARPADLGHVHINNDKMVARLGWKPDVDFKPKIRQFIDWMSQSEFAAE
ncbi:MAG: NAD-dependent epimerase/dehydratase family protein [Pseudomonadota bacterium]